MRRTLIFFWADSNLIFLKFTVRLPSCMVDALKAPADTRPLKIQGSAGARANLLSPRARIHTGARANWYCKSSGLVSAGALMPLYARLVRRTLDFCLVSAGAFLLPALKIHPLQKIKRKYDDDMPQ